MKCLDDHHHYQLESFEPEETKQCLLFIRKEPVLKSIGGLNPPYPTGELRTVHNGTTNEEVLKMLIHRLNGLNNAFPCRENSIAITHIETALLWLEKRTADRIARGVEGKHQK